MEERIKRSGKKPAPPVAAVPPPSQPQAKMPAEDKHELKHPKPSHRHVSPAENEEATASNGTKEEKTTKYIYNTCEFEGYSSI